MLKYTPIKLTTAQKLLVAMGWDSDLLFGHHRDREAHPTKLGPGRKHGHKVAHGTPPKPAKGNWAGLHKASAEKRLRRACVALVGIRQYKRQQRADKASPLDFV